MNIPACLEHLRPGAEWSLTNNDYTTLIWGGPGEAPTMAEVEAAWVELESMPKALNPTLRSFRLACGKDLWSSIEAVVNAIPDDNAKWEAQQYLEYSPTVLRTHPLVSQLAAALSLSSAEVDAVFTAAQVIDDTP